AGVRGDGCGLVVAVPPLPAPRSGRAGGGGGARADRLRADPGTRPDVGPLRGQPDREGHPVGPSQLPGHPPRLRVGGDPVSRAIYLVGDVFERMAELPDGSVDLVMTSPPFLALRSYLPADHPDKGKEIGSEATPAEFIDTLLALTAEWRRLLAPHGS